MAEVRKIYALRLQMIWRQIAAAAIKNPARYIWAGFLKLFFGYYLNFPYFLFISFQSRFSKNASM